MSVDNEGGETSQAVDFRNAEAARLFAPAALDHQGPTRPIVQLASVPASGPEIVEYHVPSSMLPLQAPGKAHRKHRS